jgi:hypothetical protein
MINQKTMERTDISTKAGLKDTHTGLITFWG